MALNDITGHGKIAHIKHREEMRDEPPRAPPVHSRDPISCILQSGETQP